MHGVGRINWGFDEWKITGRAGRWIPSEAVIERSSVKGCYKIHLKTSAMEAFLVRSEAYARMAIFFNFEFYYHIT